MCGICYWVQYFLYQSVNESRLLLIGILLLFFRFLIDNLKLIFPIVTEQAVQCVVWTRVRQPRTQSILSSDWSALSNEGLWLDPREDSGNLWWFSVTTPCFLSTTHHPQCPSVLQKTNIKTFSISQMWIAI